MPPEPAYSHFFVAVQWSESGAFEVTALPDEGPAVSVAPWGSDSAKLKCLRKLLKQQGSHCRIVVDGEKDLRMLRKLMDVSAYDVVNAAPRLRLAAARGPMLGFYGGNQRALAPRQDAEADARAIRMGWRGSEQLPAKRNPYVYEDIAFQVLAYAKRFHNPGERLVLEVLEIARYGLYTREHGARLSELLQRHVCGRGGSVIGDYAEWVDENRLAVFYTIDASVELITHARGTQAKVLSFLEGLDEQRPVVTVHLSYCTHDADDEGWDCQALLEAALGLREARCLVLTP